MYITVSRSGKIYADMGQILNLRPGDMFSFGEEWSSWDYEQGSLFTSPVMCGVVSTYVILNGNSVNAASILSTELAQNSEARFHSEKHAQLP